MSDGILVSIAVLAYNSERTIIETLESIKNQTYQNIELIVSDDCSQDKTVDITRQWIAANKNRFIRAELLTVKINSGIPANINRALNACQGIWFKCIAADDILFPNCIEACMKYVDLNKQANWLVGKIKRYCNIIDEDHIINDDYMASSAIIKILEGDIEVQKQAILSRVFIGAPAVFAKVQILKDVGCFDEQYKFLEDWPMWKKLIFSGEKCFFMDEYIVGYRSNENSISTGTGRLFNINFEESVFLFLKNELFQYYSLSKRINKILHYRLCILFQKLSINNTSFFNRKFYSLLYKMIDLIF